MTYSLSDWQSGVTPPKGFDCADAIRDGWGKTELDTFMRASVRAWQKPAPPEPRVLSTPKIVGAPVTELRPVQQENPEPATVTHIHTRVQVKADDGWMLGCVFDDKGKIKPNLMTNWALFMEHHPDMEGVFAWDAFKLRVMLMRCPPWEDKSSWSPRVLRETDYSEVTMWLETLSMTPKPTAIAPIVQTVAEHLSFDRLREYLEGLEWDGVPRVAKFANEYLGCKGDNYAPIVSERWLVSSVARGLKPGCKVDTMPILEGVQGAQKSTALRALYGDEFFTDELSDIGSKDAMMEMQGVWGIEIAEMHRFSAAETNQVKKFLTRQTDRFRPPYGRNVIEAPRRVVMCGTINPEGNGYLRDPTGARRFWPLEVGRIDIEAIKRDRDQIWAEAVTMFRAGTPWWVQADEQDAVQAEQEKRTDGDVWADVIMPELVGKSQITQVEIMKLLGIPTKDAGFVQQQRIGRVMKSLGWAQRRDRRGGEDRVTFVSPRLQEQESDEW